MATQLVPENNRECLDACTGVPPFFRTGFGYPGKFTETVALARDGEHVCRRGP